MPFLAVLLLVAVAIVGYLAGYRHVPSSSGASFGKSARFASVGTAQLEYPPSWLQSSSTAGLPGLALADRLLLTPAGNAAAQAGLLVGELAADGSEPAPRKLPLAVGRAPRTEVLDVPGGQLYAYSNLDGPGLDRTLELFVIPNLSGQQNTLLACYSRSSASLLRQCEQIVSSFSLIGQPQYDLTPDAGYAHTLGTVLDALQRERSALRARLGLGSRRRPRGSSPRHSRFALPPRRRLSTAWKRHRSRARRPRR